MEINLIRTLADDRRLNSTRDEDGTMIVRGKCGHVYDYGDGRSLGVLVSLRTPRHWNFCRTRLLAAGLTSRQNGDTEGTFTLDPTNESQVRAALREAKIKTRRTSAPSQLEGLKRWRSSTRIEQPPQTDQV